MLFASKKHQVSKLVQAMRKEEGRIVSTCKLSIYDVAPLPALKSTKEVKKWPACLMAISILLTECNWRIVVIIYFLISTSLVPFDFHFASRCQIYGTPLLHSMACWGGWHGGRPWSEAHDMTSNDNTNTSKNINGNGTSPHLPLRNQIPYSFKRWLAWKNWRREIQSWDRIPSCWPPVNIDAI